MKILECWIEHSVRTLDRTFTYVYDGACSPGCRVSVDFGHREIIGFVDSVTETNETAEEISQRLGFKVNSVRRVLDTEPLLTDELYNLAMWMKEKTLSTTISCFQTMLPAKIKPSSGAGHIVMERWVKLSGEEVSLTPKQLEAYIYVRDHAPIKYSDFRKNYSGVISKLIEKNAVVVYSEERKAGETEHAFHSAKLPLTPAQQKVMDEIRSSADSVYLLRGVTGSGKTEIYLQLAEEALRAGDQVLILVPEISLTPQMIERVSSRFGEELAIYHSGLNDQEKFEQYRKVKRCEARIVVGTRSAVFLPFERLGLIVMDEEHDTSYKQDKQPSYHCRDVAIFRGKFHHCKVVLGSATPTLDSYARGVKSVYHLLELDERANGKKPEVRAVSMKDALRNGQDFILSDVLKEAIQLRMEHKEQVILLLNRRGYNTQLRCRECSTVLQCPHCDIALSYHQDVNRLKCHTCGTEMPVPHVCPTCGSTLGFTAYGFGTQRLQEEVQKHFPGARILRMDADTTSRKNGHEKILSEFSRGEADILLGTQMIAKGLDYPNVTLVGIINGDNGLERSDFRSCEDTFDLLMQAGGRSGRADKDGEVIFQVFNPDHYAVRCALANDYRSFFQTEMQYRHAGQYPPYTYLISLTVSAKEPWRVEKIAMWLKNNLVGNYKTIGVVSLNKINDKTRARIILKGKNSEIMRKDIAALLEHDKEGYRNYVRIDVDPMILD